MEEQNNLEPTIENQQPEIATEPVKKSNLKRNIIIGLAAMTIVAGLAIGFVILGKDDNATTNENAITETQETTSDVVSVKKPVVDGGIKGLSFSLPDYWVVQNITDGTSIAMYSEDAVGNGDFYIDVNSGLSVKASSYERTRDKETGKADPLDAYSESIGAPRVDDGSDFFDQPIDQTKFKKFTNKNGVPMVAFPWSYEGCFEQVTFLDEINVYSFSIYIGDGCPNNDILENNEVVKNIIDSIELTKDESNITYNGAYISSAVYEKDLSTISVASNDFSFEFTPDYLDGALSSSFLMQGSPMLTDFENGLFKRLTIGTSRSSIERTYSCEGCGIVSVTYDETIELLKGESITAGLEELGVDIFGKREIVEAIQKKADAATYTYVKKVSNDEYLTYKVTIELLSGEDVELPELTYPTLLKNVQSLKKL